MNEKELKKTIGYKIKMLRISKGLSQKELSSALGFTAQYLSKIETGKVLPSTTILINISIIMDTSLSFFDPHNKKIEIEIEMGNNCTLKRE